MLSGYPNGNLMRYDIINYIITKEKYNTYLEVGTNDFTNYNKINIKKKECIDPQKSQNYTYNMTSDEAFKKIQEQNKKYDIIFIDGLHWSNQVTKDITNSLKVLNKDGTIVLHDCNPPTAYHARYPHEKFPQYSNRPWNGDCYKSIVKFRLENPEIYCRVVDTDWGVGIIKPNEQETNYNEIKIPNLIPNNNDNIVGGSIKINEKILIWDYFNENRRTLLNLISCEEFLKIINNHI
jgi:hypothetical protein